MQSAFFRKSREAHNAIGWWAADKREHGCELVAVDKKKQKKHEES